MRNSRTGLIILSAVLVYCITGGLGGAEKNSGLKGPYMGQAPPGKTPEIFLPGIVSTEKGWEAAGCFTPDLTEYYYTKRTDIQGMENRLYHMKMMKGKWTLPAPAPFAQDMIEYESFVFPDGKSVVFNSDRPRPAVKDARGEIWIAHRREEGWGEPEYLTTVINKGWVMFVTAAGNGNLYFTGGFNRKFGVYRSVRSDGGYGEPEYLPVEINYLRGAHPFIAPDESYLIFDAQPSGMGKSELFISFRTPEGGWTKAVCFGREINATYTENIPNVSPDGKYLFFSRNNDIYWVSAGVISGLKKKVM